MVAPKATDGKVFDVAKPGESKPDTTSRPIIVGHKTLSQDPMVKSDNSDEPSPEKTQILQPTTEKKLEPSEAAKKEIGDLAKEKPAESTDAAALSLPSDALAESSDADPDKKALEEQQQKAEAEEKERARQEELEKLIRDKKYFVNIHEQHDQGAANHILSIIILIVLLGFIAGYLAVDAGIIKTSVKLPIEFIKN